MKPSFDASAVPGFGSAVRSDLLLFPDPSTLAVLPWRPASGRVVRMFCDIRHPDGQAFAQDTRRILRRTVAKAAACGVHFRFGAEMEFYLFELDEKGHPTREPFDRAGYMDIAPEDKGENVRREICLYLEEMGVLPESSHHEEGPGQNEIDFRYSDALTAADRVIIPVQSHYLPVKGLEQLLHTVSKVQRQLNSNLKISGILITMTESRTNFSKEISQLVRNAYGKAIRVYDTEIPRGIKAAEMSARGTSIFSFDPRSPIATAYEKFTKEVLEHEKCREKYPTRQL